MSESPRIAVISGSPQLLTRSSHSLYQYVLFSVAETVKTCRGRGGGTLWGLLPGSGWRSPTRDAGRGGEEGEGGGGRRGGRGGGAGGATRGPWARCAGGGAVTGGR